MKKIAGTLTLLLWFTVAVFAGNGVLEKLKQIPEISDIKEKKVDGFREYYEFWFEQPINHSDVSKGMFRQKVFLGHKKTDAPVVAELQGYQIGSGAEGELSALFEANQLTIEHRFFDQSVPEGGIPWEYLTIKQAAADHHNIIQTIRKTIYPSSAWISTGISKGGQAAIFHRYFYPDDVEVSVPYVAPLNLSYVDPRLEKFLDKLGTAKGNGLSELFAWDDLNSSHWAVRDFQLLCFKNQDTLASRLQKMAEKAGYTYEIVGGVKRALQLIVLEYPFAFWQWGNSAAAIPDEESADIVEIFNYLVAVSTPQFFEDEYIVRMQPFFYMALTETGMYDYNIKPFKKYFSDDKKNIDFSFTMPENAKKKPFNEEQMRAISKWLQTDAEKILFIYGGSDPWYATGVDLKTNWKSRKYVKSDMSHTCRIKDFDPVSREDLINTLKEWLRETKR